MTHILASVALAALLFLLANPFSVFMTDTIFYALIVLTAVCASVYVGLYVRAVPRDEREEHVGARAARAGYVAGVVVITSGIVWSALDAMAPDPWLVAGLGAMIVVRVTADMLWS